MIPIRDINPTSRTAWLTLALIAANVVVFVFWEPTFADEATQQTFLFCNAEIPYEVTNQTTLADGGADAIRAIVDSFGVGPGDASALQALLRQRCPEKSWQASIFVSMFLHGGWFHIAGNMLFLWVFGNNVEDRLGRARFIALYVLGGLAATGLQLAFDPNSAVPNVGASGAIASILGAYLILFPSARIHTLVIIVFFITFFELPASVVLVTWFVLQLFSGVGQMGTQVGGGVAYWAHVGGFAFGIVATWLFFRRVRRGPYVRPLPPPPDLY